MIVCWILGHHAVPYHDSWFSARCARCGVELERATDHLGWKVKK